MEPVQRGAVSSRCLWLSDASLRKSRPSGPLDTAQGLCRGSRAGRTVMGCLWLCRARTATSSGLLNHTGWIPTLPSLLQERT